MKKLSILTLLVLSTLIMGTAIASTKNKVCLYNGAAFKVLKVCSHESCDKHCSKYALDAQITNPLRVYPNQTIYVCETVSKKPIAKFSAFMSGTWAFYGENAGHNGHDSQKCG